MSILALYIAPGMPCDKSGQELHLNSNDRPISTGWLFGRADDCDIVFDNAKARTVSRKHCAVMYSRLAARWELIDLDSTCGTWLNGFRLPPRDPAPLEIRDRFSLGNLPMDFIVLEGPNDTIDGEDSEGDQDGPDTIASTEPITIPPQQPQQPHQTSRTYGDSLYAFVSWVASADTVLGGLYRLGVVALVVALVIALISVFFSR